MLVTNVYVCYCKVCDENGIPKKNCWSHLEFRKDLAIAWIDMEYFGRYLETNTAPRKRKAVETVCSPIILDMYIQSVNSTSLSKRRRMNEVAIVAKQIRCTAITDHLLDPDSGLLKCQLSHTGIDHMQDKPITACQDKTG